MLQQSQLFDRLMISKQTGQSPKFENILRNHTYAGVKSVLQEKDRLGGIIGAVSETPDLLMCIIKLFEIALGCSKSAYHRRR